MTNNAVARFSAQPSIRGTALDIRSVSSGYQGSEVLHAVDLSVGLGEVVAIIGKNGMGKTTLLKTILGFCRPTTGELSVLGVDGKGKRPYALARLGVGYIAQERAFFQDLTVQENIEIALPDRRSLTKAFDEIGDLFPKLPDRRSQKAGTLSGGERKMLLLARALVSESRLLLVDEVTEGVQPSVRIVLRDALRTICRERGTTVVLVEQDLKFAFSLADRYAVMKLGNLSSLETATNRDWMEVANEHLAI